MEVLFNNAKALTVLVRWLHLAKMIERILVVNCIIQLEDQLVVILMIKVPFKML